VNKAGGVAGVGGVVGADGEGAVVGADGEGAVVVADGLVKRWGRTTALAGASCTIGGGVTGLLGPNGAGKTTFLGIVLGLHRADGGSVRVFGHDPCTAGPAVRARLGYVPEHDALPPEVTAADVVRHVAELHGLPRREATSRASDALWEVGLGEERFRLVGSMSTGQRQRVKLAQAIAHDPALVLLDEPTNGLDPGQREDMLGLIRHVGHDLGMHVVVSSHLLEEVERVSDAVVILDHGRVAAAGPLSELRRGGDELVVEVDGDPAALAAALSGAGLCVRGGRTNDGFGPITVELANATVYDVVRDAVAAGGFGLRRLQQRRATLEDVYLAAAEENKA